MASICNSPIDCRLQYITSTGEQSVSLQQCTFPKLSGNTQDEVWNFDSFIERRKFHICISAQYCKIPSALAWAPQCGDAKLQGTTNIVRTIAGSVSHSQASDTMLATSAASSLEEVGKVLAHHHEGSGRLAHQLFRLMVEVSESYQHLQEWSTDPAHPTTETMEPVQTKLFGLDTVQDDQLPSLIPIKIASHLNCYAWQFTDKFSWIVQVDCRSQLWRIVHVLSEDLCKSCQKLPVLLWWWCGGEHLAHMKFGGIQGPLLNREMIGSRGEDSPST